MGSSRLRGVLAVGMTIGVSILLGRAVARAEAPGGNGENPPHFATRDSTIPAEPAAGDDALTSSSCAMCHRMDEVFSHPVNMHPSMTIAEAFPLEDGRMGCTTCHAIQSQADHDRARSEHTPLLRVASDRGDAFCNQCHSLTDEAAGSVHAASFGQAHLDSAARSQQRAGNNAPFFEELDQESVQCISCHDGSVASDTGHLAGDHAPPRGLGATHPVGVAYRIDRGGSLRSRHALDPRVRLFDGRVGCGSCHSPYASAPDQLVVSNDGSALCLTCHDF